MSIEAEHEARETETEKTTVKVKAHYQPSTARFEQVYPRTTTVGPVKIDVMAFFHVADRTEGRKVYSYTLFFRGQPQNDLTKTLEALVGEHSSEAEFQLVEQIVES